MVGKATLWQGAEVSLALHEGCGGWVGVAADPSPRREGKMLSCASSATAAPMGEVEEEREEGYVILPGCIHNFISLMNFVHSLESLYCIPMPCLTNLISFYDGRQRTDQASSLCTGGTREAEL